MIILTWYSLADADPLELTEDLPSPSRETMFCACAALPSWTTSRILSMARTVSPRSTCIKRGLGHNRSYVVTAGHNWSTSVSVAAASPPPLLLPAAVASDTATVVSSRFQPYCKIEEQCIKF